MELFPSPPGITPDSPLAYRLAPTRFEEYVGQGHILGPDKPLRRLIENDHLRSLILWGPPGCGKTSLSRLISDHTSADYVSLNAVTAKIVDIKQVIAQARTVLQSRRKTILFIDEIHRFTKTQQDALLPDVENGLLTLIGATTQNPFFSVIPALISRSQVYELKPLDTTALLALLKRGLRDETIATRQVRFPDAVLEEIIKVCSGDARRCLNILEIAAYTLKPGQSLSRELLEEIAQSRGMHYSEDDHYDLISAFIKSMRGSDADAAVYWLARMLAGGEDPAFIARRLIIFASEDVGNADPMALVLATSLLQASTFIGMPEIRITLSQVTTYLSLAPKSNAAYVAINQSFSLIKNGTVYPVPNHLRDGHYKGAERMGFGNGYDYSHTHPDSLSDQTFLPENQDLYIPKPVGFEKNLIDRRNRVKQLQNPQKL